MLASDGQSRFSIRAIDCVKLYLKEGPFFSMCGVSDLCDKNSESVVCSVGC
jgi:hypothetical protein